MKNGDGLGINLIYGLLMVVAFVIWVLPGFCQLMFGKNKKAVQAV